MNKIFVSEFSGEKIVGTSVTVPNDAMSLADMMRRFGVGIPPTEFYRQGNYDVEPDEFEDDVTRNPDFDFAAADALEKELLVRKQLSEDAEHIAEKVGDDVAHSSEVRDEENSSERQSDSNKEVSV